VTQNEIDALPDLTTKIVPQERLIDGRKVIVPVQVGPSLVFWSNEAEPTTVIDNAGTRWFIGWYKGVRYKREAGLL